MRIVGGRLGGRIFESPRTQRTHPMSEKARGSLFNALGDISGLSVLDAYAGSGALSYEAISRGAKQVLSIDIDVDAVKTIAKNVAALGLEDSITVRRKNISGWSRNNQDKKFNIVLADPPYTDIRPDVIHRLSVHVARDGIFVLSWPGSEEIREINGFKIVSVKSLGDIKLAFYRHIE